MTINQKIYVLAATITLLAVILAAFLIYPTFGAIQKNSEELILEKGKINQLSREAVRRQKVEKLYQAHEQDFKVIKQVFIDPDIPLELISFLETAGLNSEVQLTISSITKRAESKDPWPSLLLQLSTDGSPENFLEFLEQVEASPYLIEVLDLTIRNTAATLTIKVFTR